MENWAETRAALERKLLDAKKIVLEYEHTLKPFRNITDAEYRQAKRDMTDAATAISYGDYEANKPADPLDGMTLEQLKDLYEQQKAAIVGDGKTWGVQRPDARAVSELLKIQTRIQKLETNEVAVSASREPEEEYKRVSNLLQSVYNIIVGDEGETL